MNPITGLVNIFRGLFVRFPILIFFWFLLIASLGILIINSQIKEFQKIITIQNDYREANGMVVEGTRSSGPLLTYTMYEYVNLQGKVYKGSIHQLRFGREYSRGSMLAIRYSAGENSLSIPVEVLVSVKIKEFFVALVGFIVAGGALVLAFIWLRRQRSLKIRHSEFRDGQ